MLAPLLLIAARLVRLEDREMETERWRQRDADMEQEKAKVREKRRHTERDSKRREVIETQRQMSTGDENSEIYTERSEQEEAKATEKRRHKGDGEEAT